MREYDCDSHRVLPQHASHPRHPPPPPPRKSPMPSLVWLSPGRVAVIPVLILAALSLPARAAEQVPDAAPVEIEDAAPHKRALVFPPFGKKRREARQAEEAAGSEAATPEADGSTAPATAEEPSEGPAPDEPAAEVPEGGIWEWVDSMQGEIPSQEQVEALQEVQEEHVAEHTLIDGLSGREAPTEFYEDPAAALAVDPLFLDLVDPSEFDIPIEVNPWVEKWVTYFTGPGRKYYQRWLSRSSRYQPMQLRGLEERGLPKDLVYLSMIESGYNAHAYSHAAAAGLWQFIPSTGKLYDLRIDYWVDERRDPEESLGAAMDFLGELHTMFGDWRLAWAAYNGGPGRVRRATSRSGSKDFWVLADGTYLHPETDNYVPKIMAAAIIGKHPERYGFTNIEFEEELVYETAKVEGAVELEVLARCAGTTVEEIKALNPALRRYATPPEGIELRVPVGKSTTFVTALAAVPQSERLTVVRHTVKSGETLSKIASRYGASVSAISSANGLKNVNRIVVGMTLSIPRGGSTPPAAVASSSSSRKSSRSSSSSSRPSVHVVSRGETLSVIATRYGVSTTQLKSWNSISNASHIQIGQRIALSSSGGGTSSAASSVTHTVKRGETLSTIAGRYHVRTADLQTWNGIRNAAHITVGQKLKVYPSSGGTASASSWTEYTVKRGDSLGKIATKHGCSVGQLQEWNSIRGSTIHPGQKIKVRRG